jgi:hypothetical protein
LASKHIPDGMQRYLVSIRGGECDLPLVIPRQDDDEECTCVACGEQMPLMPQLTEALIEAEAGSYNGDEPPLRDCPNCDQPLFVVSHGECRWCDYELEEW